MSKVVIKLTDAAKAKIEKSKRESTPFNYPYVPTFGDYETSVDGYEPAYMTGFDIHFNANEFPEITLKFIPTELDIDADLLARLKEMDKLFRTKIEDFMESKGLISLKNRGYKLVSDSDGNG